MLGGHHYQLQSRLTDQSYHRIIRQLHGKYTAVQQVSDSSYHALRRYGKTILDQTAFTCKKIRKASKIAITTKAVP